MFFIFTVAVLSRRPHQRGGSVDMHTFTGTLDEDRAEPLLERPRKGYCFIANDKHTRQQSIVFPGLSLVSHEKDDMILKIKQGLLDGGEERSLTTGKICYTFMGIPYGESPVGELRFRPPRPAGNWSGIRDAKGEPEWCLQRLFVEGTLIGSEDCLNINVLTPEPPNPSAPLKPVMVHVHGGAFIHGSGSLKVSSFDHLVNYDIILVTFSYRLHILGYLNLNTASCLGNCGGKDQILALKWIQENIRSFGGDPDNVTIFGESAGAASIHFLAISPLSKGLFKRAIIQSAHALSPWAFRENQVDAGFQIGRKLGFEGTDPEELANFLREQPAEVLQNESWNAMRSYKQENPFDVRTLLFIPSLEKIADGAFLPDHPKNLVKTAIPVPTIMGVAEHEGATILLDAEDPNILKKLKGDLTEVVKSNVKCDPMAIPEITARLNEFYLTGNEGQDHDYHDCTLQLVDLFSDLFNLDLYDSFEYVIKSSEPLYAYQFTYCGNLNESQFWKMKIPGSLHADESNYISLSRGFFPAPKMDDRDKEVSKNLCTLWTNFAKTGNPNPPPLGSGDEWVRYTSSDPCYLKINEKLVLKKGDLYAAGRRLWRDLLSAHPW